MPFDSTELFKAPKQETKPDLFSLEGLIAWLETQDPETKYDFMDCEGGCLIGQYLLETTGKMWEAHGISSWGEMPLDFANAANPSGAIWVFEPKLKAGDSNFIPGNTFGAALARARKVLAARA